MKIDVFGSLFCFISLWGISTAVSLPVKLSGPKINVTNSSSVGYNGIYPVSPPLSSIENQTSSWLPTDPEDSIDVRNWELITTKLRNNSFSIQPYVSNGYIGVRIPVQGQGFAIDQGTDSNGDQVINGWPLYNQRFTGAYLAGFWDYQTRTNGTNFADLLQKGGESVISTLPVWTSLSVTDSQSNKTFNVNTSNSEVAKYRQSLSLKNGVVQTNLTWTPMNGSNSTTYKLNYTIVAHRDIPSLGLVRLDITSDSDSTVLLHDLLDGSGSYRTQFAAKSVNSKTKQIWTSVRPDGVSNITAFEYSTLDFSDSKIVNIASNESLNSTSKSNSSATIGQDFKISLKGNKSFTVFKYVGIASSDAYPGNASSVARKSSSDAVKKGWSSLLESHNKAWQTIWNESDIVIPGDTHLQTSARASLYHLLANIRQGSEKHGLGDNSISVGGLSSDSYGGQIFWDADTWMFPGLEALHPNYASSILNYRTRLFKQAQDNMKDRPAYAKFNNSAIYPWTSARFGNCTSTGPCFDYQYHLNVDIAQSQWNYFLSSNDTEWLKKTGYPIMKSAADFFVHYVQQNGTIAKNGTASQFATYNMTDPDEYANHINNGAYTNAGISQLMKWATAASKIVGQKADPQWNKISKDMYIPHDPKLGLTLEYDGMNGSTVIKQADVVMMTYPLEYPLNESLAKNNLAYYADKQSKDGPAMTYAIFGIDTAKLATTGSSAYTYLLYSSQPYLRSPFYQYSEQLSDDAATNGGTNPAFPFLTGHGGFLQMWTHGFTGYRPRGEGLYLDPTLPPQLSNGYTLKGLKHQGGVFDIQIGLNQTKISYRKQDWAFSPTNGTFTPKLNDTLTVIIGSRNKKSGNFQLKPGQSLTVGTYRPDLEPPLFDGNLAQDAPVFTEDPWVAGRFPFSANDGDNSTIWQPLFSNRSSLIIDLASKKRFSNAFFSWGNTPPKNLSIGIISKAQNVTDAYAGRANTSWIVRDHKVEISEPYDKKANLTAVFWPKNNETSISFKSNSTARFIHLAIEGVQDESVSNGATLSELSFS